MPDSDTGEVAPPNFDELTNLEKLRGLPWSLGFSASNSFFVQLTFFGSAFVLFLQDLGFSKSQIGFMLALLPFFGLVALWVRNWVAMFGYKRTFLTFFGVRTLFTAGLLFTPLIVSIYSERAVLFYVAFIIVAFSLSRSIGLTAWLPWQREYIPDNIRGKYSGYSNLFIGLSGVLAVSAAGFIISDTPVLANYMVLFAIGVFFGLLSIYLAAFVPGGKPHPIESARENRWRQMRPAMRDQRFMRYLAGFGIFSLATTAMFAFIPLYMADEVGLSSREVVLLQNGVLIGGLLSSFLWGWMADRYGSKPVMLTGLLLTVLLPLGWLVMPQHSALSLYVAIGLAVLQGVSNMGWVIGSGRMLYVSLVPQEQSDVYTSLFFAWNGVIAGTSQLVGGWVLDVFGGVEGQLFGFQVGSYILLFAVGFFLILLAGLVLRPIQIPREVSLGKFAGLFVQGNPLMAVESLIRFHYATDEPAAISVTERLGRARSPLTVDELLEALNDPRFYVRFEAIVAIAHHGADEKLIEALARVLSGNDPAMSVIAAWALGRLGDERAQEALRAGLDAPYRSVKAHAARSLGTLGDEDVIPLLLKRLDREPDAGLRVAYASVLGKLGVETASPYLISLLQDEDNPDTRNELALSLARLVDEESTFIQLTRGIHSDPGTTLSQALSSVAKQLHPENDDELSGLTGSCAEALAQGDLQEGAALLVDIIRVVLPAYSCEVCRSILKTCAQQLVINGSGRMEYLVLAICVLEALPMQH